MLKSIGNNLKNPLPRACIHDQFPTKQQSKTETQGNTLSVSVWRLTTWLVRWGSGVAVACKWTLKSHADTDCTWNLKVNLLRGDLNKNAVISVDLIVQQLSAEPWLREQRKPSSKWNWPFSPWLLWRCLLMSVTLLVELQNAPFVSQQTMYNSENIFWNNPSLHQIGSVCNHLWKVETTPLWQSEGLSSMFKGEFIKSKKDFPDVFQMCLSSHHVPIHAIQGTGFQVSSELPPEHQISTTSVNVRAYLLLIYLLFSINSLYISF